MLLSGQKQPGQGDSVGRPATGKTPVQYVRIPQDDWDDFRAVAGRRAPALLRDFIRWYLRRPGAKMPERPSRKDVTAAVETDR